MSVVAVKVEKTKITIGADSIRLFGLTQEKDKLAKLSVINKEMVLGAVGDSATNSLFKDFLENHLPKTNNEAGWTMLIRDFANFLCELKNAPKFESSNFLIVYRHKVFLVSGYFIREVNDYYAIGAGMDYALAALYLGASVEKAIKAACHLSILCEEPINIVQVNGKGIIHNY